METYRLHSDCILVKGAKRSSIYDMKHLIHFFIPNTMLELLLKKTVFSTKEWVDYYGTNYADIIDSYILYLKNNNLINNLPEEVVLKELTLYNRISVNFCNAIVRRWSCDLPDVIREKLAEINIKYVQLVIINECVLSDLQRLLSDVGTFISVQLFIRTQIPDDILIKLVDDFVNVKAIFVFNSTVERVIQNTHPEMGNLYFIKSNIENLSCGYVCKEYFCINAEMFGVSQLYNSCLFGKISIDENDMIGNCLFSAEKIGTYNDLDFNSLLKNNKFTKDWNITKDQIDVCKDCEFRHMCTDCRVFIKDPENPYSQPSKCTYNPYIAKWQGEEGYVPVEECGTYTRETGFVVNHEQVAELNQELWGE